METRDGPKGAVLGWVGGGDRCGLREGSKKKKALHLRIGDLQYNKYLLFGFNTA